MPSPSPCPLVACLALLGCQHAGDPGPPASTTAPSAPVVPSSPIVNAPAEAPATSVLAPPGAPCPPGMADLPGGSFRPIKRGHGSVPVAPFCLDVLEVTVADYKACVREKKCSPECLAQGTCSAVPTQAEWGEAAESQRSSRFCNGDRDDRQDHPVNCVSWEEASTYCAVHDRRLPVPAEWEWAARSADPKSRYPWGLDPATDQPCWSPKKHRRDGTCVVKSFPADRSAQGVFDLAGNVAEWVDSPDPHGTKLHKAFGASWWAMDDGYLGATLGGVEMPSARNETVGFRCARDRAASR